MTQSQPRAWGSLTCAGKFLAREGEMVGTSGEEVLQSQGACAWGCLSVVATGAVVRSHCSTAAGEVGPLLCSLGSSSWADCALPSLAVRSWA